jgi:hypothetical protein
MDRAVTGEKARHYPSDEDHIWLKVCYFSFL